MRTSGYGDDKDRVAVRSNGEPTYFAADAAYMHQKLERFDRAVYVLGADHHGYAPRLQALAQAFGYDPARVEVLLYQLVNLTKSGEATKMSNRRGDVVTLDELVDEVGVDAARWYLVNRSRDQAIEIDVDLAREKSEKNPVYYVQYAHARIAGILRNAGSAQVSAESPGDLHRFYHHHRVLGSETQAFRLALCHAVRAVTATSLDLVGVEAPDHM